MKKLNVSCSKCAKSSEIEVDEKDFDLIHTEEKSENQMGAEATYEVSGDFACPYCGAKWESIHVAEYPEGVVECAFGNE